MCTLNLQAKLLKLKHLNYYYTTANAYDLYNKHVKNLFIVVHRLLIILRILYTPLSIIFILLPNHTQSRQASCVYPTHREIFQPKAFLKKHIAKKNKASKHILYSFLHNFHFYSLHSRTISHAVSKTLVKLLSDSPFIHFRFI